MSTNASENPAARFLLRREKNLTYFRENYPSIYEHFKSYSMVNLKVNILTETDEVDLLDNGTAIYGNQGKSYATREVETFREAFREGSKIYSINPPFEGEFYHPRFVHQRINELIKQSPVNRSNYTGYELKNFYPLIVFLGSGLGYHIELMLQKYNVLNAVIVEPDLDKFAASLYAVDWAEICSKYKARNGRFIHFILGAEKHETILWAATWNKLIECCPIFPVTTLFYNHQGDKVFDAVSDKINSDLYVYLGSWGHYDDEVRQLNNALHNFHQHLKRLPPVQESRFDVPVFIFGSGPSIDDRVETVKSVRDKVIVVSCGTALRSLEHHGIKPDFHVELESDYNVYKLTSKIDANYLKSIPIIAPSHINPMVYTLFKDHRYYFKRENPISKLFGTDEETIANGTPTCTNAAIAVAFHLGFKNLFLFGMDFGFKSREKHHASGSVFYRDDIPAELKKRRAFNPADLIVDVGVNGEKIYTIPTYFNAKRKAEQLLADHIHRESPIRAYNCSDGARIENSEWLANDRFLEVIESVETSQKQEVMEFIFNDDAKVLDIKVIDDKVYFMERKLEEIQQDIHELTKLEVNGLRDMTILCNKINFYIENVLRKVEPGFYFFIRGTLRHFLHVGYSHAFGLPDQSEFKNWYQVWLNEFLSVVDDLPDHFRKVIKKPFDMNLDPWVKQTINEVETYYE